MEVLAPGSAHVWHLAAHVGQPKPRLNWSESALVWISPAPFQSGQEMKQAGAEQCQAQGKIWLARNLDKESEGERSEP
jgi:head-tail adaptor